MSANTAADALARFLNSTPEIATPNTGLLMDRLGSILLQVGDVGIPVVDAMAALQLARPDFLNVLTSATSGGLIETFDDNGVQMIKLTPVGRSVYAAP